MNVSVGKFVNKLFNRKQNSPKKVVRTMAPQLVKKKEEKSLYDTRGSEKHIAKHNAKQAEKAKKRRAERVKNSLRKKNRRTNAKGGKS